MAFAQPGLSSPPRFGGRWTVVPALFELKRRQKQPCGSRRVKSGRADRRLLGRVGLPARSSLGLRTLFTRGHAHEGL